MAPGRDPFERFQASLAVAPAAVPLDEAALCIAAHAEPGLEIDRYLERVDSLAAGCRTPTLDGLVSHLFRGGGFAGNTGDYYDPRNSLLNHVLDRRTGIPITLAVIALEVGRRVGVPLAGVGMPGHFLLRDKVDRSVFVDAFHGGRYLDERACRQLYHAVTGPGAAWDPGFLEPIDRPAIVARMLANLHAIYQRAGDVASLRWVMRLRCALPGVTDAERREFARLMAPYN
jgi:regulator of sirC expression with transglutaminase-like and TPR domain